MVKPVRSDGNSAVIAWRCLIITDISGASAKSMATALYRKYLGLKSLHSNRGEATRRALRNRETISQETILGTGRVVPVPVELGRIQSSCGEVLDDLHPCPIIVESQGR